MKGLIDLIADIGFKGDRAKARDTLGRVYEYFLGKFAQAEGKFGGEFFTPRCIVRLLVDAARLATGEIVNGELGVNQDGLAPPLLFGSAIRQAARQLTRVAGPKLVEARRTVILGERNLHDNGTYREGF